MLERLGLLSLENLKNSENVRVWEHVSCQVVMVSKRQQMRLSKSVKNCEDRRDLHIM